MNPPVVRGHRHGLSHDTWQTQVRDALVGLGWSNREAEEAVTVAEAEYPDKPAAAVSKCWRWCCEE